MDKYEYKVRSEEISNLIDKEKYTEAVKIADTIDWRRVKSAGMLLKIAALYRINRRNEDSREILMLAYERYPTNRSVVHSLCELSIELDDVVAAIEYYKQFAKLAPKDNGVYTLRYRILEAQEASLEERIEILEELKKRDYQEEWAYELAYLYHRVGLSTKCVEECDDIILWFGDGPYVMKAMELKALHVPLTEVQQKSYENMMGLVEGNYSESAYQNEDYQETDYQNTNYQDTDYQNANYQETDYQNTNYQGTDYQNTAYQGTDYQNENYPETDYQNTAYQETGYQNKVYQNDNYDSQNYGEQTGYPEENYGNAAYSQDAYPEQGYGNESYVQNGYAAETYENQAYAQNGYAEEPYGGESYARTSYVDDGYGNGAYAQNGYAEEPYGEETYGEEPYAQTGYVDDGYGNLSYVEGSYQNNGYTGEFYVEQTYDENGNPIDSPSYAEDGSAQEDYTGSGYGTNAYDANTYGSNGYADNSYNAAGYNNASYAQQNNAAPSTGAGDMSQYNTINLQKVVAESMKELFPDDDDVFAEDREKYNAKESISGGIGDTRIYASAETGKPDKSKGAKILDFNNGTPDAENSDAKPLNAKAAKGSDKKIKEVEEVPDTDTENTQTGRIAQLVTSVSETAPEPHTGAIKKVLVPGEDARFIKAETDIDELRDTTEKTVIDEQSRMEYNDENVYREQSLADMETTDEANQTTGPMNLDDVLVEWERMKLDNAKKHQEEIKQHVLTQTGKILANFDNSIKSGILGELERDEAEAQKKSAGFLEADDTGDMPPSQLKAASEDDFDVAYISDKPKPAKAEPEKTEADMKKEYISELERVVAQELGGLTNDIPQEPISQEMGQNPTAEGSIGETAETAAAESAVEPEILNDNLPENEYAANGQAEPENTEYYEYAANGQTEPENTEYYEYAANGQAEPENTEYYEYTAEGQAEPETAEYYEGSAYTEEIKSEDIGYYENEGYTEKPEPENIEYYERYAEEPELEKNGYYENEGYAEEPEPENIGHYENKGYAEEPEPENIRYYENKGYAEKPEPENIEYYEKYAEEPEPEPENIGYYESYAEEPEPENIGHYENKGYAEEPELEKNGYYENEGYTEEPESKNTEYYQTEEYTGEPENTAYYESDGYADDAEPENTAYYEDGGYAQEPEDAAYYEGGGAYTEEPESESAGYYEQDGEIQEYGYSPYRDKELDPEDVESIAEMAKEDALKTQEIKMNTADLSTLSEKIVATTKKEAKGAKREEIREFTPEEQALFENFAVTKKIKKQIVSALDNITLAAYTGNIIITGDAGLDTVRMAKNLIKEYQESDANFSGKLAKITGEKFNQRNVKEVFEKLNNGGIIIEKANGMNEEKLYEMALNLNQENLGIVVIMEDTKKEITKLLEKQAMIADYFNIRIDLMEMDNNALVAYAKNYALALEYSIDELGTLALYTRIANMQSGNHVVTKDEVRDIIDEAIWKSKKSKIKNFVDVLFARRYDNEDMIVLKERDFM